MAYLEKRLMVASAQSSETSVEVVMKRGSKIWERNESCGKKTSGKAILRVP